jgi:hypothetical protein
MQADLSGVCGSSTSRRPLFAFVHCFWIRLILLRATCMQRTQDEPQRYAIIHIMTRPHSIVSEVWRGYPLAVFRMVAASAASARCFFVACAILLIMTASCREDPKAAAGHVLVMDYPEAVGDKYRIEAKAVCDIDEHGWAKEKDLGKMHSNSSTEVTGTMTVLALSKNKRATKARIQIDTLSVTSGGKTVLAGEAGDELILERKDQAENSSVYVAALNGKDLDAKQTGLISMAFNLVPPNDNSSANQIYSLSEKKKPGESWPVNSQAFIDAIDALSPEAIATQGQIKGTVKFLKVFEDRGEQYGLVQFEITSTGFVTPAPGKDIISKEVNTSYLLHVPLNGKRGRFVMDTKQVDKTVSDTAMNADGVAWVLRLSSTATVLQTLRMTFIPPET